MKHYFEDNSGTLSQMKPIHVWNQSTSGPWISIGGPAISEQTSPEDAPTPDAFSMLPAGGQLELELAEAPAHEVAATLAFLS